MKFDLEISIDQNTRACDRTFEGGFEHVKVIWHNWEYFGPKMGVAVPRAPVGTRSPEPPQKYGHRP